MKNKFNPKKLKKLAGEVKQMTEKETREAFSGENFRKGYQLGYGSGYQKGYEDASKAFGDCKKCYGKGYSTSIYGTRGSDDFGGEGFVEKPTEKIKYCTCDRGKQIMNNFSK